MPHSKHRDYTADKQDIPYTELKACKSPWKHRTPAVKQSPVVLSEEQLKYAELTFHRTPQLQPRKQTVRRKRQGPKSAVWRVVTCVLGVLCVVLMITMGILVPKYSSCDPCSHDWIAFGNNFYLFFRGTKSWAESKSACEELNSHLLDIDSKAELENLLLFEINGWILVKKNQTNWSSSENETKLQHTLIDEKKNHSCRYLRGSQFIADDCSSKKPYACEFNKM